MEAETRVKVARGEWFRKFSCGVASCVGASWAFGAAIVLILGWAVSGPLFHFSDTWQLVINTATTIITFLMVFLIQNTQNRDARAIHLKLDELIRSTRRARNALIDLENMTDEELEEFKREFEELRLRAKLRHEKRNGSPKQNGESQLKAEEALAIP